MKFFHRQPFLVLALVLLWRVLLLVFTVQPIPFNDAFGYDGAVINFLHGGSYCNPSFAMVFPISGREVYAGYPPLYQLALLVWMKLFGTSVISAMTLHLALFAVAGFLTLAIVKQCFPAATGYALAALLLFGFTFVDRPESLAYVFGLAALWLVVRQLSFPGGIASKAFGVVPAGGSPTGAGGSPAPPISRARPGAGNRLVTAIGLTLALWLGLYTSVIVGAFYFGAGFLACATACLWRRSLYWFAPFIGAAALFAVCTLAIARFEPLWWAGFLESARQQSVLTNGLRMPFGSDLVKLVRTTPVFLLGLVVLPALYSRRKTLPASPWLAVVTGVFVMGWVLLVLSETLLTANYITYTQFTQILLAAGLLALVQQHFPRRERLLRAVLLACVALVSVRAIGMTTWGVACAWKNSYQSTQTVLRAELEPFVHSDQPVFVSSAYLYRAADLGVKNPVHCDWYFDHANWTDTAQMAALIRSQPPKLLLTQFDYYRSFEALLAQLRQQPGLVNIQVRNLAAVRPPDALPALQRVVQHISWPR